MCYFIGIRFCIYPEKTRIHYPYEDERVGETEQELYERALSNRREQNALNRELNKQGKVASYAELMEARRKYEREMQAEADRRRFKKERKERKKRKEREDKQAQEQAEQEAEQEQKAEQEQRNGLMGSNPPHCASKAGTFCWRNEEEHRQDAGHH